MSKDLEQCFIHLGVQGAKSFAMEAAMLKTVFLKAPVCGAREYCLIENNKNNNKNRDSASTLSSFTILKISERKVKLQT